VSSHRPRHSANLLAIARGEEPCDLCLLNCRLFVPPTKEWITTDLAIAQGVVVGWGRREARVTINLDGAYVIPGLIDAHMHIESTKLWLPEFARAVIPHGTAAVAADPHEMANVAGQAGVRAMIEAARELPMTIGFAASSCVPASPFESPGATFSVDEMRAVMDDPAGIGVAEVMNFPGVVAGDPLLLAKIASARNKRVDGHAPGLSGFGLDTYLCAGVESDHEVTTLEECDEKRRKGMWIFARQGSAAQNIAAIAPSVVAHGTERMALCSDDREPDLLLQKGHMNDCVRTAVAAGIPLEDALVMATLNPARYHGFTHLGSLSPGMQADFGIYDSLDELKPAKVYHKGSVVAQNGGMTVTVPSHDPPMFLSHSIRLAEPLGVKDFVSGADDGDLIRIIGVRDHSLWTVSETGEYREGNEALAQLTVVERHHGSGRRAHAFVSHTGLTRGALASTVAHDAHNIMVLGANNAQGRRDMATAVAEVVRLGGGQVVSCDGEILARVALPLAGLMSGEPVEMVAQDMVRAQEMAHHKLGVTLASPFMTLSFLGLSVIPSLKLTDQGLVDVDLFRLVELTLSSLENNTGESKESTEKEC